MVITRYLLFITAALMASTLPMRTLSAEVIGFIEKYALAENRQEVLDELIPGSDDYYFFQCLHHQVSGDLNRAETFLAEWEKKIPNDTPARIAIRDRQRLLTYGASPERTIDYLKDRLGINLNHSAPPQAGERRWPDSLDANLLDVERLLLEAVRANQRLSQHGLTLLADKALDSPGGNPEINLNNLVQQIDGQWYSRLGQLVITELRSREPQRRQFGDVTAHRHLTLAELNAVAEAFPDFRGNTEWINQVLLRLRPSADAAPSEQPDVRFDYLQTILQFVRTLPESQNSLKAATLYQVLEANLRRGEFPLQLFIEYLRLPRISPIIYVEPRTGGRLPNQRALANLNQDFSEIALLPPIRNEMPLVRAYLEHFLRDANSTEQFDRLIEKSYLNRVFAETKLLYGIGEPQRWYDMLSGEARQQLNDSVELTLSETNPEYLDSSKPTRIQLDIKGIDELIVRVYEINTMAYYRTHDNVINTDIDLDGLVATNEQRIEYKFPKVRRHREEIELGSVEGRGVWVVDFLGGGLRSRAILRRGDLQFIQQKSADGQLFTIVDEDRQPVPNAHMIVAGRQWTADQLGRITIPPVDQMLTRLAVLMDNELAVQALFLHEAESYDLRAAMLVNRQQLQAGKTADLIIRPRLYMAGSPIDPKVLTDPMVTVTAIDHDGISTTRRFENVLLSQVSDTQLSFRVPSRVARVSATLSGKIKSIATGRELTVEASEQWEVNGIDQTTSTMDVFLTRDKEDWIAEVRGRNGEPIQGAAINVSLYTVYRDATVDTVLQSNELGRVNLGPLTGVSQVVLSVEGRSHIRNLNTSMAQWPERLNAVAGEVIQLPIQGPDDAIGRDFRLLELRANQPTEDLTQTLLKIGDGFVSVGPLPPGDYCLFDRHEGVYQRRLISVTEGPVVANLVAGKVRSLELSWPQPVTVSSIQYNQEGLRVQLAGDFEFSRIHVFGSRYLPDPGSIELPLPVPVSRQFDLPNSGYVSDLRLGDEYLYVLRRQYAKKYPGVMLPSPSLLLAPWVTDETSNDRQNIAPGAAVPPAPMDSAPASEAAEFRSDSMNRQQQAVSQNLEFLPTGGVVLSNLEPSEDGVLTIPLNQLGESTIIRIVVANPLTVVERTIAGQLEELLPRDRRLNTSLAVEKPYAFERAILVAGPDQPLNMSELGSAQVQVYAQLSDILQLYRTISGDSRLDEFTELGRWASLDEDRKRAVYGRLASHELHVFLKYKDAEFFGAVVRPYLENKKEKKLVDAWLLDQDLTPWTSLWQYAQLNAFEKALLAHELPAMRETVLREFRERIALQRVSPQQISRLVEFGLAGRALSEAEGLAFMPVDADAFYDESVQSEADGVIAGGYDLPSPGGMGGSASVDRGGERLMQREARLEAKAIEPLQRRGIMMGRMGNRNAERFFQQLDATKQWAENHWDHIRVIESNESLIPVDPFWLAWAEQTSDSQILNEHVLRPTANRHSSLIALALLDLPFEAKGIELPSQPESQYQPEQKVAVVTKRLRSLEPSSDPATLLVGQRFEGVNAPSNSDDEVENIKIAPDEYLTATAYRGQIVITNPTPQGRQVDVLWQIPTGSLPLAGSKATDSQSIEIAPFEVKKIEYQFYFPAPGSFQHYPVCLSSNGKVVARGDARTFNVVTTPSTVDEASWQQVALAGTSEKIASFLSQANIRKLDLSLVAHRMSDRPVYESVIALLEQARVWQPELWAYAFLYRDRSRMTTYLEQRSDLVQSVGPVFRSQLLVVEPISRTLYEHLEYAPLVPERIHSLRPENEIMNNRFLAHYRELMRVIAHQPTIESHQELALCYYMLLQNRIEQAIEIFGGLKRDETEMKLQYDYLEAYLSLHQGNYDRASQLAVENASHPVPRWRERFLTLQNQLRQRRDLISGSRLVGTATSGANEQQAVREDAADLAVLDRESRQEEGAAASPDVRVRVEGDALIIDHRNAQDITINFYGIDLELLFSKTPFVREGLQRMASVRPGRIESLQVGGEGGSARFLLDEGLSRQTLLVEVVAGAARDTTLYYGGRMTTFVSEGFGQLQVADRTSGDPVSTAYVKVYAKERDGTIRFHKDGYTDLRGRFDYVTLSGGAINQVDRFAILVLDQERGATLHEVNPPTK